MIGIKKLAVALAAGGTALGLIGMGVGASFSDGASATQNISTGSFGCTISSPAPAVVVNNGTIHTVTLVSGPLMSSAAGTAPLVFTVKSTGTIQAKVSVTQTTPAAPFTSRLTAPAPVVLNLNQSQVYDAGLQWPELTLADINGGTGKSTSITYTTKCDEASAPAFSTLTGTAGFYSDQYGSYTLAAAPVVDMAASTITWTIPVNVANSPEQAILLSSAVPSAPQGRFVAVPVTGNVSTLATVSFDAGLASQASKFHAIYRSTSYGLSFGNLTSAPGGVVTVLPVTGLNLATTSWNNAISGYGHNATDNGLGVTWAGVTGTGTVTIVLAFSTN